MDFEQAHGRPGRTSAPTCTDYIGAFSDERARHLRALRVRRADRAPGRGQPALPGGRRSSPPSTCTPDAVEQRPHGPGVRGTDPHASPNSPTRPPASTSRRGRSSA
ncbi:MAG: hypothetical protein MZU95_13980 [Desulfomicrobium escambiense]|nr:hypothetical protein [Desulfomicrobium escambiense]